MDEKPRTTGTRPRDGGSTSPDGRRRMRTAGSTGVGLALAVASVATSGASAQADESYTVRRGDTVSHIAQRTGTSVTAIVRANNLSSRAFIRAGQQLTIPSQATAAKPHPKATPTQPGVTCTVRAGDTLSEIAVRYHSTVAAIAAANKLGNPSFIRIGQKLAIPGTAARAPSAPAEPSRAPAATYTVRDGDTVAAIAAHHGTTIRAIATANHLTNPSFIRIGQKLVIPGTKSAAPGAVTLVANTFAGRTYPQATVDSANKNKAALLAVGVPSKAEMQALVVATARKLKVSTSLAQAVAYQESGFNQAAVSPANAIGTMQVIPSSGQWASELVGRPLNLLDPEDNVTAGVVILRRLVDTSPNLATAIASYYQGARSVREHGMFADTRVYVANVQTLMARFA